MYDVYYILIYLTVFCLIFLIVSDKISKEQPTLIIKKNSSYYCLLIDTHISSKCCDIFARRSKF